MTEQSQDLHPPTIEPIPKNELLQTALATQPAPAPQLSFPERFLSTRSKIQYLLKQIFDSLRKYLLLKQQSQVLDSPPDTSAMHDNLRTLTSKFEILSDILSTLERYLPSRFTPTLQLELVKDLEYLVGCIEPYNAEEISLEGNEQLAATVKKVEKIFGFVVEKMYDLVNLLAEGTEGEVRKYADIVVCLGREVVEILHGEEVVKRMSNYDPYRVKQTKTNTQANKTMTVINTARKTTTTKQNHYERQYILFDRDLQPEVFDYVQPPLHRVYISEAAKAYAQVAAIKISNIVLQEQFQQKPQILTQNYFNEDCQDCILHYCRPHSKQIILYNLVDIFDALSITKQMQQVKQIKMNFLFSDQTRSIITPAGKIFITNAKAKKGLDDLTFFQFSKNEGSLKARPNLIVSKREHAMVHLNGCIYVVGGRTLGKKCTTSCHRYDIRKRQWAEIGSTNYPIRRATLCAIANRYIYRFGGLNQFDYIDKNIQVFDSVNNGWTIVRTSSKVITQQIEVLYNSFALPFNQGNIYIFGGDNMNGYQTDTGYTMTITEVKERKRKPSKVEAVLRSLKETKRTIFSYAGRFVEGSALIYRGSIYFLREKYF